VEAFDTAEFGRQVRESVTFILRDIPLLSAGTKGPARSPITTLKENRQAR